MDTISSRRRSENMRRIRGCDTKPELVVRSLLHRLGYRFRLQVRDLPGRPDIVLPRFKKAIFVHGCFWHQHRNCADGRLPKSRKAYWVPKMRRNKERDQANRKNLRKLGWRILVVWDCQTGDVKALAKKVGEFLGG
jgi:DNA mismatch endonuclease (patch repair protein)